MAGKVGSGAGIFDATTTQINIPASTALAIPTTWTVAAWVNSAAAVAGGSNIQQIVSKWGGASSGQLMNYSLGITGAGKARIATSNATCASTSVGVIGNTTLNSNVWYFVVGTYSGNLSTATGTLSVYVNGALDNSLQTVFSSVCTQARSFVIGAFDFSWSAYSHHFNGLIDDVRIYNRALSTAEIQALYNAEK